MIDDDRLLEELKKVAPHEDETTQGESLDRWEKVASGALDDSSKRELEEMAEGDTGVARALEVYQPLGQDFRTGLVDKLHEMVQQDSGETSPSVTPVKRVNRIFKVAAVALPAAAAILLVLWFQGSSGKVLPEYQFSVDGRIETTRGQESGAVSKTNRLELTEGSILTILLRPLTPAGSAVEAAVFLEGKGRLVPLVIPCEADSEGAVRFRGEIGGDTHIPVGDWELIVVISSEGELPSLNDVEDLREATPSGYRLYSKPIRIIEL